MHGINPLLYDVYCGGGGATKGYQRAGFRVVGIDNKPQPRYCGDEFIQMDALEFLRRYLYQLESLDTFRYFTKVKILIGFEGLFFRLSK